eukprot:1416080-Lingulodinium_polyedra.AAC.1
MEPTVEPKKRAIPKAPEPVEKRRRREAIVAKVARCRKLKSFIDRIRNELAGIKSKFDKMKATCYPEQM